MQANAAHIVAAVLLAIAAIGTAASTVYLVLVLLAARGFQLRKRAEVGRDTNWPAVSVLKPFHGLEPSLEANLETFFQLDYPDCELVFGCRSADDAGLSVIEKLRQRYPHVSARVVFSGTPEWPNAKVYSLDKMIESSANDYFVISDSDITVEPDFLYQVIAPLLERDNGLVTCLYRGVPAEDFWSRFEALGMSVEFASGVLVARMLEGMKFALGAVMAVRRDALNTIGGIASTANYYSDDFVLGQRIADAGYNVVLEAPGVGHVLTAQSFAKTFRTQLRWMQSTRYSRPKGHFGTGLTFAVPFGIFGFIGAAMLGSWWIAVAFFVIAWLNRVVQSYAVGWRVIGDWRARRDALIYPVRDLLGFVVWVASYLGGSTFDWRGELYRFTAGGRIEAADRKAQAR